MEDLATTKSFQFAQLDGRLPASWVLLDNQLTVNIFCNKDLLKDIKVTSHCMRVRCNASWMVTNRIGRLPGYPGEIWYNPEGVANILSLADAEKYFRVHYISEKEKEFVVEKLDGTTRRFLKTDAGLYCFDTAEHGTVLINTVADNKSRYTIGAYRQAVLARKLQTMIGYPSTRDFLKLVDNNLIPNCLIGRSDIIRSCEN
jgi:hypothetical protein